MLAQKTFVQSACSSVVNLNIRGVIIFDLLQFLLLACADFSYSFDVDVHSLLAYGCLVDASVTLYIYYGESQQQDPAYARQLLRLALVVIFFL